MPTLTVWEGLLTLCKVHYRSSATWFELKKKKMLIIVSFLGREVTFLSVSSRAEEALLDLTPCCDFSQPLQWTLCQLTHADPSAVITHSALWLLNDSRVEAQSRCFRQLAHLWSECGTFSSCHGEKYTSSFTSWILLLLHVGRKKRINSRKEEEELEMFFFVLFNVCDLFSLVSIRRSQQVA